MPLFLKFLLAHILGDFVFQREKCVKKKEEKKVKSVKLYSHIGVHVVLLLFLLQFNGKKYQFGFLLIFTPHYSIDLQELYIQKKTYKTNLVFYRSNTAYINIALSKRSIC